MTAAVWRPAWTEGPRGGALADKLPVAPEEDVGASGRDGPAVGWPDGVWGVGGRAAPAGKPPVASERLAMARGLLAEYEAEVGLRRGRRFATGLEALDRALGGGLLRGTLCEISAAGMGLGAMSLALVVARAAAVADELVVAAGWSSESEPVVTAPLRSRLRSTGREGIPWDVGPRWESRSSGALADKLSVAPGLSSEPVVTAPLRSRLRSKSAFHTPCENQRRVFLIDPGGVFYAPAAAGLGVPLSRLVIVRPQGRGEAVWAMEQALRCGSVGAVVGLMDSLSVRAARQLQLAAEAGGGIGLLVGRAGRSAGVKFAAVRMVVERVEVPHARTGRSRRAVGTRGTRWVWVRLSRARPGISMDVFMLELGDAAGDVRLPAVSGDRSGEGGRRWIAG